MSYKIAFNTANLVGRVSDYRYALKDWGAQHRRTVEETTEAEWAEICRDIRRAGYRAVEVWQAHADPAVMTEARVKLWKRILEENGLTAVAYAGGASPETFRICQGLGIPHTDGGGMNGLKPAELAKLCAEYGIAHNFENHPQKSVAEIQEAVGGGNAWVGVAVDTGWLGTQGVDAPEAIRALGLSLVRHVHLKDVRAIGSHETVPLSTGIVDIEGCLRALREIGYYGWYSWEDEPEDRNPLEDAARVRLWLEERLAV